MRRLWIAFAPYIVMSVVHVGALAVGTDELAGSTKLALMPLLVLAVVWGARGTTWTTAHTLVVAAIGLSWIGDGAAVFLPWLPTVPMMLLFFGLAHLFYITLFWRRLAVRRVPPWAVVYAAWWGVLLAVLWPHLGGLVIAVAAYGLVLGGTAVAASRCHPLIAWGGAFFLASDSILAFRLFLPEAMPEWTSPAVMFTYCLGQGLIAAGVLVTTRVRRPAEVTA
ncbi:lysoplasmalogenase [Microbacterium sp. CFH 90308]|uniref:Lysoplasmalogenase n=1 Tax=Microbacterium salsuginis TaxID=2722803 RepID=A0ABX1KFN7_9MICO|nr:lysoplasmalogenase [Microbacterium sp. CFH 90308]NLP85876.1 lysoplasmalogenase [Microbacterium sp. CFH 90308]